MPLGSKELFLKVFQEHYKKMIGLGSVDIVFLTFMGLAYIERGDLPYSQWLQLFEEKAYLSGLFVTLFSLFLIWLVYPVKKERASYEI